MTDLDLSKYLYIEYTIAVVVVSEIFKFFLSKIDKKFIQYVSVKEPKWISLFVATILAIIDWAFIGKFGTFHFYQMTMSFAIGVLGYDYVWKIIKNAIFKKDEKPGVTITPEQGTTTTTEVKTES